MALRHQFVDQRLVRVIEHDVERDFYLSAEEALKYGLIDKVLEPAEHDQPESEDGKAKEKVKS